MSTGFTTFQQRPVFPPLPLSWADRPGRTLMADARPVQIGFGAEVTEPLQEFTTSDLNATVRMRTACDLSAFERFFAYVYGPLRGFWMPGVESVAKLVAVPASNQLLIEPGSLLLDHVGDGRWKNLWLVPPRGATDLPMAAQVQSVTTGVTGDLVTLTAALPTVLNTDWSMFRLFYGRLATSDIKLTFYGDNQANAQIRLVELPEEYTAIELGERPAFLYHFSRAAGEIAPAKDWYFTSFDQPLVRAAITYTPAPLSHSKWQQTTKGDRDGITLNGWLDGSDNPLATYIPFPPQQKIIVTVYSLRLDALDGEIGGVPTTPETVYAGEVATVVPSGRKLEASCQSRVDALDVQMPRFIIQTLCNYEWGNPYTCKAVRDLYRITGTVSAMNGSTVTLQITGGPADQVDHWYALGRLIVSDGNTEEQRAVQDSTRVDATHQSVTLNAQFSAAMAVGMQFVAYPGCDLTDATCTTKYNNFVNFGGHPCLQNDLGLKAIDQKSNAGGKGGK